MTRTVPHPRWPGHKVGPTLARQMREWAAIRRRIARIQRVEDERLGLAPRAKPIPSLAAALGTSP